jgi:hypothetical protein
MTVYIGKECANAPVDVTRIHGIVLSLMRKAVGVRHDFLMDCLSWYEGHTKKTSGHRPLN